MEFTVCKADLPNEQGDINNFLNNNFFKMALLDAFGLQNEAPPPIPDCANFVMKAVDTEGQLIGVAFNTTKPTTLWRTDKTVRERQLAEFFKFFDMDAKINELPEKSIELWLLAVSDDWRQRGVARKLVEESVREARDSGYKMITLTCTGEFVAKLARSLGWQERYCLAYKDYPARSGNYVYLKPTPPHLHLYFYVKQL